MKKRILSILLAALMIISVLPAYALADNGPLPTDASGITATKSAEWVNGGKEGIAKVTIEVRGTAGTTSVETAPTDIVLVVDASASMEKSNKLTNAKTAAKGFVDKFLAEGSSNVKIAVVSYSKEANNVSNGLQTSADTLKTAIDNIKADGGTNIQAGIHMAQEILDDDKTQNVKKIMIVLSDGEPTYSYRFVAMGTYKNCKRTEIELVCRGGDTIRSNAFEPDYTDIIGNGSNPTRWINLNAWSKVKCPRHNDVLIGKTQGGVFDGTTFWKAPTNKEASHDIGTIWEANQAKTNGTIIYGIGYGVGTSGESLTTMTKVASDGKYKAAGADNISEVFADIASEITTYCAYEPKVIDVIGNDFELATGEGYTLPEGVTYDASSKTLTWNVGDHLDEKEKTLTFYVKYTGGVKDPDTIKTFETNENAKLEYSTTQGGDTKTQNISNAEVDNLTKKVTYTVTGTKPNENKPNDALVWIGGSYDVANPYTEVTGTHEGEQGTFTFDGWNNENGEKVENIRNIENDITLHGSWSFEPYQWTLAYKWGTKPQQITNGDLPTASSTKYATKDAALNARSSKTYSAVEENSATWTFNGWDNATVETDDTNHVVTLVGNWTSSAYEWKLAYEWEGTAFEGRPNVPTDDRRFVDEDAARAATKPSISDEVQTSDGKWTFDSWDIGMTNESAKTVTYKGTWKFTPDSQPGEDTYSVGLAIHKTVNNVHGTAPAETYNFVVYYKDAAGNPVYLRDASNPLTISLEKNENYNWDTFEIKVTESQLNDWRPEDDVHYAYVKENKGSTEYMSYAEEPVRVKLVDNRSKVYGEASAYAVRPFDFYLFSEQDESKMCLFTNVYNKTTGRDVTPAKVSPQLNRDDHVAYIMGYPDGNVRPEGEITRAEACTIFFRLLTKESRDYYFSRTNDYTDVSRTDWFNNAISTLSNAGIVTGYADGTFRPDQPITRGEMAKIIANFARLGGATKSFTDLSGHWAKSYVELAAGNGWIAGYPDGTFGPDKKITRAETVTMINRVLERVPAKESRLLSRSIMLTFPDNKPGEWYYIAVQEASNSHTYQRSAYETAGDEMWLRLIENVDWTKLEK